MASSPKTSDPSRDLSTSDEAFRARLVRRVSPVIGLASLRRAPQMVGAVGRASVGFSRAIGRASGVRPAVTAGEVDSLALRPPTGFWRHDETEEWATTLSDPSTDLVPARRQNVQATPTWTSRLLPTAKQSRSSSPRSAPQRSGTPAEGPSDASLADAEPSGNAQWDRLREMFAERETPKHRVEDGRPAAAVWRAADERAVSGAAAPEGASDREAAIHPELPPGERGATRAGAGTTPGRLAETMRPTPIDPASITAPGRRQQSGESGGSRNSAPPPAPGARTRASGSRRRAATAPRATQEMDAIRRFMEARGETPLTGSDLDDGQPRTSAPDSNAARQSSSSSSPPSPSSAAPARVSGPQTDSRGGRLRGDDDSNRGGRPTPRPRPDGSNAGPTATVTSPEVGRTDSGSTVSSSNELDRADARRSALRRVVTDLRHPSPPTQLGDPTAVESMGTSGDTLTSVQPLPRPRADDVAVPPTPDLEHIDSFGEQAHEREADTAAAIAVVAPPTLRPATASRLTPALPGGDFARSDTHVLRRRVTLPRAMSGVHRPITAPAQAIAARHALEMGVDVAGAPRETTRARPVAAPTDALVDSSGRTSPASAAGVLSGATRSPLRSRGLPGREHVADVTSADSSVRSPAAPTPDIAHTAIQMESVDDGTTQRSGSVPTEHRGDVSDRVTRRVSAVADDLAVVRPVGVQPRADTSVPTEYPASGEAHMLSAHTVVDTVSSTSRHASGFDRASVVRRAALATDRAAAGGASASVDRGRTARASPAGDVAPATTAGQRPRSIMPRGADVLRSAVAEMHDIDPAPVPAVVGLTAPEVVGHLESSPGIEPVRGSSSTPADFPKALVGAIARDQSGQIESVPSSSRDAGVSLADQFMTQLSGAIRRTPAPLPMPFRPMAEAIAGPRRVMLSTDESSRKALRSVGKVAASTGDTIHLDPDPIPSARLAEVMAHELTHVAHPSPTPRFFDDLDDSPEERRAECVAAVMARSPVAPTASTVRPSPGGPVSSSRAARQVVRRSADSQASPSTEPGTISADALAAQLKGRPAASGAGVIHRSVDSSTSAAGSPSAASSSLSSGSTSSVIRRAGVEASVDSSVESTSSIFDQERKIDDFRRLLDENFNYLLDKLNERQWREIDGRGGRFWKGL